MILLTSAVRNRREALARCDGHREASPSSLAIHCWPLAGVPVSVKYARFVAVRTCTAFPWPKFAAGLNAWRESYVRVAVGETSTTTSHGLDVQVGRPVRTTS